MNISISTGTFYQIPFPKALLLIKNAGFEYIELLAYWHGGDGWKIAQNIKDVNPREVLKIVKESGLKISTLHDGGGVIDDKTESVIAKSTYEYLEYGAPDIPCVIFHTPHKKTTDKHWWDTYQFKAGNDLKALKDKVIVCIENMLRFDGYIIPLLNPVDLMNFANDNSIFVNIDTTHYAQSGVDITEAAKILKNRVRTIHLSDYIDSKAHVFPGEGLLDFKSFMNELNKPAIHSLTIECDIKCDEKNTAGTIERLKCAYNYANDISKLCI